MSLPYYYYYCYYYYYHHDHRHHHHHHYHNHHHSYPYSYSYSDSDSSTPLLLPPFFPKNYTGSAGSSWQQYLRLRATGTRHRTRTVLIDQYSFGMRSIGCSSTHLLLKLLLIYGSVFVSSSLRLPPSVHVSLSWGNLFPLSPSMQRSAVKPEAHT